MGRVCVVKVLIAEQTWNDKLELDQNQSIINIAEQVKLTRDHNFPLSPEKKTFLKRCQSSRVQVSRPAVSLIPPSIIFLTRSPLEFLRVSFSAHFHACDFLTVANNTKSNHNTERKKRECGALSLKPLIECGYDLWLTRLKILYVFQLLLISKLSCAV